MNTKGPWEIEIIYHDDPGYERFAKRAEIVTKREEVTYVIAKMDWSNPMMENAYLIIAAPDMLEACKNAHKLFSGCLCDGIHPRYEAKKEALEMLEKAIAKAERRALPYE